MDKPIEAGKPFKNCKYGTLECHCCHSTDYGACPDYLATMGIDDCVYCNHSKKCHEIEALRPTGSHNTPI